MIKNLFFYQLTKLKLLLILLVDYSFHHIIQIFKLIIFMTIDSVLKGK